MTIKESSIHNKVSNYGYIIAALSLFCYWLHWWLCIVSAVCNLKGVTVLVIWEFTSKYLPDWVDDTKKNPKLYMMKKADGIIFMETNLWLMTPKKKNSFIYRKKGETVSSSRLIYIPFLNLIADAISPAIMIH